MAEQDNPLQDYISGRENERAEEIISEYANCQPPQLLAKCDQMIRCLAGFDTVFLLSPSDALSQLELIDEEWLSGFDRTFELLCLAASEWQINFVVARELVCAVRAFWTGYAEIEETRMGLDTFYIPGTRDLFCLQKRLMVEVSKVSSTKDEPVQAETQVEKLPTNTSTKNASRALLRLFTNGIADDRIERASRVLANDTLNANEKLVEIDALLPIPATASAEQLGEMLKVTKQGILKTDWWKENRKGEKASEVGRRREIHRERAENYKSPSQDDDE